jgi:sucrose-phosphate synthase
MKDHGIYVLMISVHGLIRGRSPELGRDPDTGGQVIYVLELARALAQHPDVARVDLLTRMVEDPSLAADYAVPEEPLAPGARIVRIPFGPRRYIRKELLWDHLDHLVDGYLAYARRQPRLPDLIHGHYGDAGYVAMRLASLLAIPFVQTAHSLGRYKMANLLQAGKREGQLERQFNFSRRIQAEEEVLAHATRVIASTRQETVDQYGLYSNFDPRRAVIIPPGTDLSRFAPPRPGEEPVSAVAANVYRFLRDPLKPTVLCVGRPVPRKNLIGLMRAFGEDPELRERANLVLVAGNRGDIRELEEVSRATWEEILFALDRYDLYGHVALPKAHEPSEVPELYRFAARRKGLCVNPAYSETFGLTLIEAAASGLPVVATASGGPRDIVANCRNGLLLETTDPGAIAAGIKNALSDRKKWGEWSRNGLRGVREFYTWDAHVARYLKMVRRILHRQEKRARKERARIRPPGASPFLSAEWALVFDLDRTLVGDRPALEALIAGIGRQRGRMAFGVVTGRRLESALFVLRDWGVDPPDVLISSVGTEIHYGPDWRADAGWENHIRPNWRRADVAHVLQSIPGLRLQAHRRLGPYKLSYHVNPRKVPEISAISGLLLRAGLRARLVYSQSRFLDVLPHRASKGQAVRYLALKWGIPIDRFVVAGDSGSDLDMLTGNTLGIVVANHSPEVASLRGRSRTYFAQLPFAAGVMEGLEHFGLLPPAVPGGNGSPLPLLRQQAS